jgi:hypothetical protein
LSRMIQSGMVTVNNVVISDPRVPFGGDLEENCQSMEC